MRAKWLAIFTFENIPILFEKTDNLWHNSAERIVHFNIELRK